MFTTSSIISRITRVYISRKGLDDHFPLTASYVRYRDGEGHDGVTYQRKDSSNNASGKKSAEGEGDLQQGPPPPLIHPPPQSPPLTGWEEGGEEE